VENIFRDDPRGMHPKYKKCEFRKEVEEKSSIWAPKCSNFKYDSKSTLQLNVTLLYDIYNFSV